LEQGCSQGAFHGPQIGLAAFVALGEDADQKLVYFPRNFLMDRNSRFFSWSVHTSGGCCAGRSLQIFSLMSTKSPLSFWSR